MTRPLWIAAVTSIALLTGCAGQPAELHRYTLPDEGGLMRTTQAATHTLAVTPIQLASFLESSGMVYQTSEIEVKQAQGHLWADDLSHQLERQLRAELSRQLSTYRVLPAGNHEDIDMKVAVSLEEFQGRYDGKAVIAGQYQLRDGRNRLLKAEPFRIERPLTEDGYPALVKALAEGWREAADQMAQSVSQYSEQTGDSAVGDSSSGADIDVNIDH
ncbi:PqiC family protein [Phytohalomonas tamaricis]|uniref:PqiC family protein n=1 Tax=Phytohalomonas tamaricis TaxID=2081032 RepID=UPI000D0B11CF|nr:ABC-type transport auxiliary lipoprotein family protein [Phytohalomonas tamaricis]